MTCSNHASEAQTPGDNVVLEWAVSENRVLVTMDKDFGGLVFQEQKAHCGLVRLPDVAAERRIELMETLLREHLPSLISAAVITGRGGRVRLSRRGAESSRT